MLARGRDRDTGSVHSCVSSSAYDQDVFLLSWRPTLTALTAVFEATTDPRIHAHVAAALRVCANISARFGLTEVFDSIIIALAKQLFPAADGSMRSHDDALAVAFGRSPSAQLAAVLMFELARKHGDFLREGWKNLLASVLQMYNARLLPACMVETEDLLAPSGTVSLLPAQKEPITKADSSIFSSALSYLLSSDSGEKKDASADEVAARQTARDCVTECGLPALFEDSKFLHIDSLLELSKALAQQSHARSAALADGPPSEGATVVFLELLCNVTLWNHDRIGLLWQNMYNHLVELIAGVADPTPLVRRAVVNLLRLARRLLRKDDVCAQVVDSVRILYALHPAVQAVVADHVAAGIVALIKDNSVYIERSGGWDAVLGLAATGKQDRKSVV